MGTAGINPGLEAVVGVFIDGVYRSRSGFASLTSITAYRSWTSAETLGADQSDADIFAVTAPGDFKLTNFTQEICLYGVSGRLMWQIGTFYANEKIRAGGSSAAGG